MLDADVVLSVPLLWPPMYVTLDEFYGANEILTVAILLQIAGAKENFCAQFLGIRKGGGGGGGNTWVPFVLLAFFPLFTAIFGPI